jgi:hypothetical protein
LERRLTWLPLEMSEVFSYTAERCECVSAGLNAPPYDIGIGS